MEWETNKKVCDRRTFLCLNEARGSTPILAHIWWNWASFIQVILTLREAEGRADAALSRLAEAQTQLEAERRTSEAAIKAAGGAQRNADLAERPV